jgi:hypothetical protein
LSTAAGFEHSNLGLPVYYSASSIAATIKILTGHEKPTEDDHKVLNVITTFRPLVINL